MRRLTFILFITFLVTILPMEIFARKYPKLQNLPRYDSKKIHFGFTLGINNMDFKIKQVANINDFDSLYVLEAQKQKGFNLGIVSNLRLGNVFDLRFLPRLVFAERIIEYSFRDGDRKIYTQTKPIESTFVDFQF